MVGKYWNRFSGSGGKTPPPAVDSEKKMVIAVLWGTGYSGCSNNIETIERVENVMIKDLPLLGHCDMEVYPLEMVEITTNNLPVKFSGSAPASTNRKIY